MNDALNETYIGYGAAGKTSKLRQIAQDSSNKKLSLSSFFSRAKTKAGRNYKTANWDLVSAIENGTIKIEDIKKEDLSNNLQEMPRPELEAHIKHLATERKRIQAEINSLTIKREAFIVKSKREIVEPPEKDLDDALTEAIKQQAISEGFSFH